MKQNKNSLTGIQIKAYSTKEIAELYNVSGRTLTRWLVYYFLQRKSKAMKKAILIIKLFVIK
jgi:hypothetical protein